MITDSISEKNKKMALNELGIIEDWNFFPTQRSIYNSFMALYMNSFQRTRPDSLSLRPIASSGDWVAYFVFAPNFTIRSHHHFTLQRLRDEGFKVAVICATERKGAIPDELQYYADALYWKGLDGFDFSAYTIILEEIVRRAPNSNILLMNDSVFGPLHPLRPLISRAPWDFIGFTGAKGVENHIQSYSFAIRKMDSVKLQSLRTIFREKHSFNVMDAVIRCQEIPMARVASHTMPVGCFWFPDSHSIDDPCHDVPDLLVDAGFPFIKRSLIGKFSFLGKQELVLHYLLKNNHPDPR